MNDDKIWYFDKLQTVDIIDFIQNWLEDNISEDLYCRKETSEKYSLKIHLITMLPVNQFLL